MRLSELLERIRPAGAPGAAGESEQQRRSENRDRELAGVVAALQRPERAAADTIDQAQRSAEGLHAEANHTIAKLRAELPEQLAVQRATVSSTDNASLDDEQRRILGHAAHEADRITQQAAAGTPKLVAVALDSIWSTVLASIADPSTD